VSKETPFATEAGLVAAFCTTFDPADWARDPEHAPKWTAYHETAGWDLLLVHQTGVQIGIEAKLSLNAKVLEQALAGAKWADSAGPDYRAVLVPGGGMQNHLVSLAHHVGITIIQVQRSGEWGGKVHYNVSPRLPDERSLYSGRDWPNWCPVARCKLPDYVPDVTGGHSAPVALTEWKIKAIKLMILLERNGSVNRHDMKVLGISPSRWTDLYHGFLTADPLKGGYVPNGRTPDLKAQHPVNWTQIETDFDAWSKGLSAPGLMSKAS
jgi:hypothetical protein